ncbi:Lrp/AsnC family transcriptional regulator [Kitasatospora kifunensis]|uniref:DNA-binding Lrp family transcriptional regulator n=1 Tax=Kitasatospora kifunensis TaxID=58351 RepID=A0A7W7R0M2_KITKI|nr:Lrp/AsnC family transcriptional regulator [Kitasatospora kifunensis]MBB4923045.1 DNA-binding Lrp family transcriptional regulator [Kitasatospora kifunensis]
MQTETTDPATLLDPLDRRLVCALQVDGRAEPGLLAQVLGVSVRTVTRRLARLRETGALRVVLLPRAADEAVGALLLRVRVLRGRVAAVADALVARSDIPFVDLMLGGQEISAVLVTDQPGRDQLLYRQLPGTDAVVDTTVYAVLHLFADAAQWRAGLLTPTEAAALTPAALTTPADPAPATALPPVELDRLDRALLGELAEDARRSAAALAQAVDAPESTVRRRLRRLAAAGLLRTHATVDPRLLGMTVDANLWLAVPPGRLAAAGRALAAHPQVHGVVATSGPHNLMAAVFCPDYEALYRFTTEVIGPLGADRVETAIVGRAVKRAGVRLTRIAATNLGAQVS